MKIFRLKYNETNEKLSNTEEKESKKSSKENEGGQNNSQEQEETENQENSQTQGEQEPVEKIKETEGEQNSTQEQEEIENQANSQTQGEQESEEKIKENEGEQNSSQEQEKMENQANSQTQGEQQLVEKIKENENEENSGKNENTKKEDSEEKCQSDVRKAFREMLKHNTKNENISTSSGIELTDFDNIRDGEIPESVMNVLIEKFLNKTFVNNTDLNAKRESLTPTIGDVKWNIPDLIKHKTTKQYNDMLHDKYGFKYENGKDEKIPLAFYFDLSGSMEKYSRILALLAFKLLKKDVKVLIGANEYIEYRIDSLPSKATIDELEHLFNNNLKGRYIKEKYNGKIQKFNFEEKLDTYLIEKNAKKVAIFSDFDPKKEIEKLSKNCEIYWFCTEERKYYKNSSLSNFKGHFYSMHNIKEFFNHLKNINNRYYENMQRTKWEGEERC